VHCKNERLRVNERHLTNTRVLMLAGQREKATFVD
jgi:hypothetical protein